MPRIIFGMINNIAKPVGGVKVIYQAAGALRRAGFDAYVLTENPPPPWLTGNPMAAAAATLDAREGITLAPDDHYVATDSFGAHRRQLLLSRGTCATIYIQNHNALTANREIDWAEFHGTPMLAVSRHTAQALHDHGFRQVDILSPGIDRAVFRPAGRRRPRVCYMPRKWPEAAAAVRARLGAAVEWLEIDGMEEAAVAEAMAGSTIFLNFGRAEGLGLPPLEAMAAGCLVCGFAGQGTLDYARPENGLWVREGDIEGCVKAVEQALTVTQRPELYAAMVEAATATAAAYDLDRFVDGLVGYFTARLAGASVT
ncbi:MAG: glycosyltransferase [Pseudomonadota bacterium]|nr:glycosyltransferase [Pseudomonadota bacterium]